MNNSPCVILLQIISILVIRCHNTAGKNPCNSALGCISNFECPIDEHWAPGASSDGCCPGCVKGLGLDQIGCDGNNPCAPGLTCAKGGICKLNIEDCLSTKHLSSKVSWKPDCDASSGKFRSKQCRGDAVSGRCFCYSATGRRIFGWEWRGKASDMTCACSRLRADLEATGRRDVTLHCTANGNFEELQCDDGLCWCVEPKAGRAWPNSPVVPLSLWKHLPCYNGTLHGDQYLRRCESASYAQEIVRGRFVLQGHVNVSHTDIACDYDGSYGKYEVEGGFAYCTWRDGERISPFQVNALKLKLMTCNCARDQKTFIGADLQFVLECEGNGNYQMLQSRNGNLFCIDRDGFEVANNVEAEEDCSAHMFG
ncbi:uncharacterized protein LOC129769900 isoform X2 [Toxorhynchites rutilus septentrionalis]|uniref:uncharacterized protein LOC129769900 isoform X2 n=1 Tax=Toxorhynchites rutilus septentrionalis TaxID=329112 RepID=UPI0024786B28|nr:uncharacterized protein LOC129769900 isoform X2 [Toxorhynchites rutilus septentrionalis]